MNDSPFAPNVAVMQRWEIPKNAVLCLLFIGVVYTLLHGFPADLPLNPVLPMRQATSRATRRGYYRDELGKALNKAATEDKYMVVTNVNKAYVEGDKPMLDVFLDALWLGEGTHRLVRHLLVGALDSTSLDWCRFLGLHCYYLEIEGGSSFEGEKVFMSEDFLRIMWTRILFLRDILARGYSLVFTDTDIMWLRDPFPKFDPNRDVDFQISADLSIGDLWSENNPVNAGFCMVRSNNRIVALFEEWYRRRNRTVGTRWHRQDILEQMLQEGVFNRGLFVKVRILDASQFSYFYPDSEDISDGFLQAPPK